MLIAAFAATSAAVAAYLVYSFEFFIAKRFPEPLEVGAKLPAVAASDLHLGHRGVRDTDLVGRFADGVGARTLILAGDVFDRRRPFRGKDDLDSALAAIGHPSVEKLLVTLSSHSHDPILRADFTAELGGTEVVVTTKPLRVRAPPLTIFALHGDLFCKSGFLASLYNRVFGELAMERAARRALRLRDEWLLAGHTHLPGIDAASKLANPGCWKDYWRSPATKTVVLFTARGAELVSLPDYGVRLTMLDSSLTT